MGGDSYFSSINGSAIVNLMNCVQAIADNKNTEMKAIAESGFFSTGNPCFIRVFSAVKAFLSRFLD